MNLKTNDLHVWRYVLNKEDYSYKDHTPLLSADEIERSERYIFEQDKIRYCCNRFFVKKVLAKYLGLRPEEVKISYHKHGKPYLADSNLFFNYSYRKDQCILGISKLSEVGIDIEFMKTLADVETFISFTFSRKEKEIIYQSEYGFSDTLFKFWTFKEAIIKAIGIGLNTDLRTIDLSAFFYSHYNLVSYDSAFYTIRDLKAPVGCKAAFAVKSELVDLVEFDYK